jgi:hypothetical protein
MDLLTPARRLFDEGRFGDALAALPLHSVPAATRNAGDLLRADLLERTGALRASRILLEEVRRRRGLTPAQQAEC